MAVPAIPVLLGGVALLLAGGSRRRRTTSCSLPVDRVSLEDTDEQDRWVRCADRTEAEVRALSDRLTSAGRTARGAAVVALWTRRRSVEDQRPDGQVSPPIRTEVDRTLATTDQQAAHLPVAPAPETVVPPSDASSPARRGATSTTRTRRGSSSSSTSPTTTARTADYGDPHRTPPAGFDAAMARSSAPGVASCLRQRSTSDCRRRVTQFQRYAGIPADGIHGPLTYAALVAFGASPPAVHGTARTYVIPGAVTLPARAPSRYGSGSEAPRAPAGTGPLPEPMTDAPPLRPAEPFGAAVDHPSLVITSTPDRAAPTYASQVIPPTRHDVPSSGAVTYGPELPHASGPTGPSGRLATHVSSPPATSAADANMSPDGSEATAPPSVMLPQPAPAQRDERDDPAAVLPPSVPSGIDPPPAPASGPDYGSIRALAEAARDAVTVASGITSSQRTSRLRAFQTAFNHLARLPGRARLAIDGAYGPATRSALARSLGVEASTLPQHAARIAATH